MKINSIQLENFRNFSSFQTDFEDVNIIWGENAQGKTNLLEAIYLFTGARSFRGAKEYQLITLEKEQAKLSLTFEGSGREQTAEITLGAKKNMTLNGVEKRSRSQLGEEIKAIIFSPDHLSIIKDGPAERRSFIDNALCQLKANYAKLQRDYQKALSQRNFLLKDIVQHPDLSSLLSLWNHHVAHYGAKMVYQRLKYIEALTPYVKEQFEGLSRQCEKIEILYSPDIGYTADEKQIEERLTALLEECQEKDILLQTTTEGPHRDEIELLINGKNARSFGSQGQQRSCVLALKLAEAALLKEMTGIQPVALLDDVMSELDQQRQDYIMNHIEASQVFITCCDKDQVLRLKKGKTIHIANGTLV